MFSSVFNSLDMEIHLWIKIHALCQIVFSAGEGILNFILYLTLDIQNYSNFDALASMS